MIRLPLAVQSTVILLALAGAGAWWLIEEQKDQRVTVSVERARAAAHQVQSTMDWVSKNNGVWFVEEPGKAYLNKRADVSVYPPDSPNGVARDANRFHQRSPSSVVDELAEIMTQSGLVEGLEVMTGRSITPATPLPQRNAYNAIANAPDSEYTEVVGGTLVYARAIKVGTTCLNCHDSIDRAPASMQVKFRHDPTMFGYKPGSFVGALAVGVPLAQTAPSHTDSWTARIPAMVLGLAIALTGTWFLFFVLGPLKKLSIFSKEALSADPTRTPSELHLVPNEHQSRNELHAINDGLNTLLRSQHLLGATQIAEGPLSDSANRPMGSNTFESETF